MAWVSPTAKDGGAANSPGLRGLLSALPNRYLYAGGLAVLLIASFVLIAIWGSEMGFPENYSRTLSNGIDTAILWTTRNGAFIFDTISYAVLTFLLWVESVFSWVPWPTLILGVALLSWKTAGWRIGLFSLTGLAGIGLVDLWPSAMETMALIVVAVTLSIGIAIPVGIIAARNDTIDALLRPLLDGMQTMPSLVYLVPAVMFFGIGNVPAIFATIVYAVPPAIRLTNLGIRQVSPDVVEAGRSFGTTPGQLLWKVQIPMAVPTIMAGINQTTMMALAMVVIASFVGAGGLGEDVMRALGRLEAGKALLAGLGIVVLAIIIDRITQAAARGRQEALIGGH